MYNPRAAGMSVDSRCTRVIQGLYVLLKCVINLAQVLTNAKLIVYKKYLLDTNNFGKIYLYRRGNSLYLPCLEGNHRELPLQNLGVYLFLKYAINFAQVLIWGRKYLKLTMNTRLRM